METLNEGGETSESDEIIIEGDPLVEKHYEDEGAESSEPVSEEPVIEESSEEASTDTTSETESKGVVEDTETTESSASTSSEESSEVSEVSETESSSETSAEESSEAPIVESAAQPAVLAEDAPEAPVEDPKEESPESDATNGVTYTYNWDDLNTEGHFNINIEIGADAEGDQTIDLGKIMIECLNAYAFDIAGWDNYIWMPGDSNPFTVTITTADGLKHTYVYKYGETGEGSVSFDTVEFDNGNPSGIEGFDGKDVPVQYTGSVLGCDAIADLCGVKYTDGAYDTNPRLSLNDVASLADKLAAKGYTGSNAMSEYLLDYYNEKCGLNAASINDFPNAIKKAITGGKRILFDDDGNYYCSYGTANNGIYTGITPEKLTELEAQYGERIKVSNIRYNTDGSMKTCSVQFIYNDDSVAAMSYDWFYYECLSVQFGDDDETINAYLADYMENKDGIRDQLSDFLNGKITADGITGGSAAIVLNTLLKVDGANTGNAYMNYPFGYENSFSLEQLDGGITVNKVDEEGEKITSSPADFNLYYITVENDQNVIYYYALDEDGNGYFTTDKSLAAILATDETGSVTVQYLLPNTYYLQEITAPDGFTLNEEALAIEVSKGTITEVNFENVAVTPTPSPIVPTERPVESPSPSPSDEPTVTPEPSDEPVVVDPTEKPHDEATPTTEPTTKPSTVPADVTEKPHESATATPAANNVQTGDDLFPMYIALSVLALSGIGIFALKIRRKSAKR